jgi:hypothetical protein
VSITPLAPRILKLADSVEKLGKGRVPWALGKVANALIEQAKQQAPDDPVLAQIDLFQSSPAESIYGLQADAVSAILRQVAEALPQQAPATPVVEQGGTIMGGIASEQS